MLKVPIQQDNEIPVSGIESDKGSSPVDYVSSGIDSNKSAKSAKDNWGDLKDENDISKEVKVLRTSLKRTLTVLKMMTVKKESATTDEDDDEGQESAKGSVSEPIEGDKGPTFVSEAESPILMFSAILIVNAQATF